MKRIFVSDDRNGNWRERERDIDRERETKRREFEREREEELNARLHGCHPARPAAARRYWNCSAGSGKTVAFVVPMLTYIARLPPITEENENGPYAVVMVAQQIEHETVKFARYLGIRVVSIVGGQSIQEQAFRLRQRCEVVIATPGRLLDCLERRYAVLNQCNYIVLDEADRMIDMGFEPQIVGVLDAMSSSNVKPENEDEELDHHENIYRTTYMFSATMPPAVERLARKYLRNPAVVTVGTATNDCHIKQRVIMIKENDKLDRLQRLLNDEFRDQTTIEFVNKKKVADNVSNTLEKGGYRVTALHGGKSQDQREKSLEGFRTNRSYNVLVATDVAGHGIDVPDVAHVINYDMPGSIEAYTHRIGRTGRAGKMGVATTFLTLHDSHVFYDLKQMLIQSNCPVPPSLLDMRLPSLGPVCLLIELFCFTGD
ncbi:P-loop containing nucleoside triphosphate hydrolases superfamily protein [Perilla frutescens var. frutescens]|nr:P-loop containing nucleoside triphosphate hydrolases superfamily protein [Perilla frutescens var. frutescens]